MTAVTKQLTIAAPPAGGRWQLPEPSRTVLEVPRVSVAWGAGVPLLAVVVPGTIRADMRLIGELYVLP